MIESGGDTARTAMAAYSKYPLRSKAAVRVCFFCPQRGCRSEFESTYTNCACQRSQTAPKIRKSERVQRGEVEADPPVNR